MSDLTPAQIAQYREEFKGYPESLKALEVVEEYEGNLEETALRLAGRETEMGNKWLKTYLQKKEIKSIICKDNFRKRIAPGLITGSLELLLAITPNPIPPGLATVIVIYLAEDGIDWLCNECEDS